MEIDPNQAKFYIGLIIGFCVGYFIGHRVLRRPMWVSSFLFFSFRLFDVYFLLLFFSALKTSEDPVILKSYEKNKFIFQCSLPLLSRQYQGGSFVAINGEGDENLFVHRDHGKVLLFFVYQVSLSNPATHPHSRIVDPVIAR